MENMEGSHSAAPAKPTPIYTTGGAPAAPKEGAKSPGKTPKSPKAKSPSKKNKEPEFKPMTEMTHKEKREAIQ